MAETGPSISSERRMDTQAANPYSHFLHAHNPYSDSLV